MKKSSVTNVLSIIGILMVFGGLLVLGLSGILIESFALTFAFKIIASLTLLGFVPLTVGFYNQTDDNKEDLG